MEEGQEYSDEFIEWAESEHMRSFIKEVRESQETTLMKAMVASSTEQNRLCDMSAGMEVVLSHMEAINGN